MELPVGFLEDCTCSGSRLHNGRKTSEFTPSSTFMLAEIITQAGLPEGAINIVTGDGLSLGNVESTLVDKIAFTGSTAVGKRIMAKAAPTLKRISLLGGRAKYCVPGC